MHLHHQVPVGLRRIGEGLVAQDAGVADQDVYLAVSVQGGLEDVLAAFDGGDIVPIGHGLAAGFLDLVDHLLGGAAVGARPVAGSAQVIDHHLGAFLGEQLGVGLAQAAAGPGHDGHFSVEQSHGRLPKMFEFLWEPSSDRAGGLGKVGGA